MPRRADPAKQLSTIIANLQAERQAHVDRIAELDALFRKYGIQLQERPRRGRPPGRRARKPGRPMNVGVTEPKAAGRQGRRRKRGTFEKSGLESILDFVKSKGKAGATTAEINQRWKSEGRGASAYKTLGELTKEKRLKKEKLVGEKGSRYRAA